jgi:hypothetical protein
MRRAGAVRGDGRARRCGLAWATAVLLAAVLTISMRPQHVHAQGRSRTDATGGRCDAGNIACRKALVDRLMRFAASQARTRSPEYTACLRQGYEQLNAPGNDFKALDLTRIDCAPVLHDFSVEYQRSLEGLLRTAQQEIEVNPQARIIGGRVAEPCDFPNAVAVTSPFGLCSGVLVDDRAVLTAAHCLCHLGIERMQDGVYNENVTEQVEVKAARAVTDASIRSVGLKMQRPYAKFNNRFSCPTMLSGPDWGRDLAVLFLKERLISNCPQRFRPARIASPRAYFSPDARVFTIVGFGLDDLGASGVKRWANVPVVSKICGESNAPANYGCLSGHEAVFADRDLRRDSCAGDSGGPVYLHVNGRPDVVAVTSRGVRGASCGPGGVYTLISPPVVDWMRNQGITINGETR